MFPGHGAQIYRNDAGEVLGWDYPSDDPTGPHDDEADAAAEAAWEAATDEIYSEWGETAGPDDVFDEHDGRIERRIAERTRRILREWREARD